MRKLFHRIKPSDPLLTTRWLDVTCGAAWVAYVAYSLATILSPPMTFSLAGAPSWYSLIWSAGVGLAAAVAAIAAHWLFYDGRASLLFKKRLERDALAILLGFILIYEVLLIDVVTHGDYSRLAQIFNVLATLPLPIFRIVHLNGRIRRMIARGISS